MTRPNGRATKGTNPMFATADQRLRLANDWIAREHRHAADARLAAEAKRRHRLSLRRRAAALLIQAGERRAAEPALTPSRSR